MASSLGVPGFLLRIQCTARFPSGVCGRSNGSRRGRFRSALERWKKHVRALEPAAKSQKRKKPIE
jgi:hypothetical protein